MKDFLNLILAENKMKIDNCVRKSLFIFDILISINIY